jgi:hypothetical protein
VNPDLEFKELAFLDNRRNRCDAVIEEVRQSWAKRCAKNEENRKKQEAGGKGK